jgi:hypothetical protein
MKLTFEHFKKGCESIQIIGRPQSSKPILFVTQNQISVMVKEGEKVDMEKMTVNGIPYTIVSNPK